MRFLLDVNVVLDLSLGREPWRVDADAIWAAATRDAVELSIAAFSLPTLFYVMTKAVDAANAMQAVALWARSAAVLPVDREAVVLALAGPSADFEDNLQLACAVLAGVDALVTRDPDGFVGASVAVLSPAEAPARLAPP